MRWITKPADGDQPFQRKGNLLLDGRKEMVFSTLDGEEIRIPYRSITDLQFGKVPPPPRPRKPAKVKAAAPPAPEPAKKGGFFGFAGRMKKPHMPHMSFSLPTGNMDLLMITHNRNGVPEQSFFQFNKPTQTYVINAISIKSNVAVRKVGYRDPWTPRTPGEPVIAGGGK
ncbi:MAG: hypothetical protein FJW39_00935 [Acidobacteria bacterium]|nr:hypothetical protein [Acidobacteriota bacterium]